MYKYFWLEKKNKQNKKKKNTKNKKKKRTTMKYEPANDRNYNKTCVTAETQISLHIRTV